MNVTRTCFSTDKVASDQITHVSRLSGVLMFAERKTVFYAQYCFSANDQRTYTYRGFGAVRRHWRIYILKANRSGDSRDKINDAYILGTDIVWAYKLYVSVTDNNNWHNTHFGRVVIIRPQP